MAKQCIVTGKRVMTGHKVSHSNRHTKRTFKPNLHKRRLMNPPTGEFVSVWITAQGLKTLKKWDREGKTYDLKKLKKEANN